MPAMQARKKAMRTQVWKAAEGHHDITHFPARPRCLGRPRFPAWWLDAPCGVAVPGQNRSAAHTPSTGYAGTAAGAGVVGVHVVGTVAPGAQRLRRFHWAIWGLLSLLIVGLVMAVVIAWQAYAPVPPQRVGGIPTTRVHVEGTIQEFGVTDSGMPIIVVVAVNGRPSMATLDFNQTAVFQNGRVFNISHLRPGQQVRLIYERGVARSIEIVRQPTVWR